jgi:hypothetical protein
MEGEDIVEIRDQQRLVKTWQTEKTLSELWLQ